MDMPYYYFDVNLGKSRNKESIIRGKELCKYCGLKVKNLKNHLKLVHNQE